MLTDDGRLPKDFNLYAAIFLYKVIFLKLAFYITDITYSAGTAERDAAIFALFDV